MARPAWLLLFLVLGCGPIVSPPARRALNNNSKLGYQSAPDLIPADLDVVLRIDLQRMRNALDASEVDTLTRSASSQRSFDGLIRMSLAQAKIVWVGLRSADLQSGDRVMVLEFPRDQKPPQPDALSWRRVPSTRRAGVRHYRSRGEPGRASSSDIYLIEDRSMVFVSTLEQANVARVLREGPDTNRGQPESRGLLSLDYRAATRGKAKAGMPRPLEPSTKNKRPASSGSMLAKYPHLERLIRGINRLQASADISGKRLDLTARFRCGNAKQANRVERFLRTLRDAGSEREHLHELLRGMRVERDEETVMLRWALPRAAIIALLRRNR